MQRFAGNVAYWGGKLLTDSLRDIKSHRDTSRYVERDSDQIGYKPPQKMPTRRNFGPVKAGKKRAYGSKPRTSYKKRKRTMTRSYKPRKMVRKKYKKTTAASYGLMDVSKAATAPKTNVVIDRRKTYGSVVNTTNSKMAWIGISDIGDQKTFLRSVARAVLQRYLVKLGDFRTKEDYSPDALEPGSHNQLWKELQVLYKPEAYNTVHEAAGVASHSDGGVITNNRMDTLADTLGDQFHYWAERGFYPADICFYGDDFITTGTVTRGRPIIYDNRFGEHIVDAQVTTLFRLHNISPSDQTDAGENPANTIHDINANPINGKVFTFRNQRPTFHVGYEENIRNEPTTRDGMEFLNRYDTTFDVIKAPSNTVDAFAHIEAPPLNARAVWSNVAGQGTIRMAPGSYRTYNAKFGRSMTLRTLIRDTVRVRVDTAGNDQGVTAKNPPLGSSALFCFQPSMRTSGGEIVKLGYDQTQVYKMSFRFKKQMGLPTRNIMQT